MSIRVRLIALVSLITLTLACIVSLFLIQEHTRYRKELIVNNRDSLITTIESLQHNLNKQYSTRLKAFIQQQPQAMKAFADRDREKLLKVSAVTLNILKKENEFVTAMFFILPDNGVFLRSHRSDLYGDNIEKLSPLAVRVNRTKKSLSGLENVKQGLRYRVCEPVFDNGQYVGMVGIGIDIRSMLRKEKRKHTEIELIFSAQQTEHMHLLTSKLIPLHDSFLYPDSLALFSELPVTELSTEGQIVTVNDRIYTVFVSTILADVQEMDLARVLAATDITDAVTHHRQRMLIVLLLTFALLVTMGKTLYFGFGRILTHITRLQEKLEKQNLLLEDMVAKRTMRFQEEMEKHKEIDRKYRQLTENSGDWIWEVNGESILTYSNRQVYKIVGFSATEIVGTPSYQYIVKADRERVRNFMAERTIDHASFKQLECSLVHRDGHEVIVEISADPLLSEDGSLLGYRALARDITTEVKKREQQGLFLEVFKTTVDAILIIQEDRFIDCNEAAVRLFEVVDKDALLNQHPADFSPYYQPDGAVSVEKAERMIGEAFTKSFLRFEWLHCTPTGKKIPCEVTLTKIVLNEKMVLHVALQNLTEIKKEQEHLLLFQEAMEQSLDGIAMADLDGYLQFVNSAWARMHGYDQESLIGQELHIFHAEEQFEQELIPFQKQVVREGFNSSEVGHITKEGHVFPTFMSTSLIKDALGTPMGFVSIAHDITQHKKRDALQKAAETSELANQAKSEFLANMSHELRTPMHGILSYASFGVSRINKVPREKLYEYFREIADSGDRLMLLLNDLLDLAKLEAGKMSYSMETRDIGGLIEECLLEFRAMAEEKQVSLQYKYPNQQLKAWFDVNRIGQVVRNLLSNAIKFSDVGQEVTIECAEDTTELYGSSKPAVRISVTDQGVGVPEGELEAIFDKFIQSSKTKNGAGGTGLGLPICRAIVAHHKGAKIWAEMNPKGGTIFNLLLLRRNLKT